jgi:ribosomal protein S18 acetylase RimI-like enzyme
MKVSDLKFRNANQSDIPALKELGMLSYGKYFPQLTKENAEKLRENIARNETWASLLAGSTSFVCEHHKQIVGMAFIISSGNPWDIFEAGWSYIRMLGVHPDYEGNGIARALTRKCIEHATTKDEKIIALHTSEIMDAARHIYESIGFKKLYEIPERLGKKYWIYTLDLKTQVPKKPN